MFKLRQLATVGALLGSLAALPAWAAPVIHFVDVASPTGVVVDVVVHDLAGDIVAAYDLDVRFDSTLLSFSSLVFGGALGDEGAVEVMNIGPFVVNGDTLDFSALSLLGDADLLALQGGNSVTLAQLSFTTLAPGADASSLAFVNWGEFNDVKGANNQIIIGQQVPEPASYALVGLALAGLLGSRLRRGRGAGQRP